jgi:hypothetical protein
VRAVSESMSRIPFVVGVGFACVLGCTRAPSVPPKPASVPEGAVLIPGFGAASREPLWVTCTSDARCSGPYRCSLFSSHSGALVRQGSSRSRTARRQGLQPHRPFIFAAIKARFSSRNPRGSWPPRRSHRSSPTLRHRHRHHHGRKRSSPSFQRTRLRSPLNSISLGGATLA